MKVLIVDNEAFIRDLFTDICGLVDNCECFNAKSCSEASEFVTDTLYDILFIDYSLDDGDGITLLSELRGKGVKTPAYLITGWDRGYFSTEQTEKFTGILQKPFNINDVITILRNNG